MTNESDKPLESILGKLVRRPEVPHSDSGGSAVDPRHLVAPMVVHLDPLTRRIAKVETLPAHHGVLSFNSIWPAALHCTRSSDRSGRMI
jgi:hypothetical protein